MPVALEYEELATVPDPMDAPVPAGPTVLLVEDSNTQRRVVQHFLARAGYHRVFLAVDGVAALEHLERARPAVVLTDLHMPRMDGLVLVEQIRERWPQVPVILMTGGGCEKTAVAASRPVPPSM